MKNDVGLGKCRILNTRWELDDNNRSTPIVPLLCPDGSPVSINDSAANGKPKARASRLGREERIEDVCAN